MAERFHLFVSAGPDMEMEREVIGRVVAQLPVQLGWEIKRTPPPGEQRPVDLGAVVHCDLFVLMMGQDIAAPVGVEWDIARRSERRIMPLLRKGLRTPAAAVFLRDLRLDWQSFETVSDLENLVRTGLVAVLLDRAVDFKLTPQEWEVLNLMRKAEEAEKDQMAEPSEPAGAGGGGIILGPEDAGSGGVVVGTGQRP